LVGKKIRRITAGGSAGSIIGVYFESDRILQPDHTAYEWYLAVECSWRLEAGGVPLSSSLDDNSEQGAMAPALRSLIGCTVSEISASMPALDLVVNFSEQRRLVVFCDVLRAGICWYLLGPNGLEVSVEPAGRLLLSGLAS
jgi:hypothetical protein